jgi:MarR family transcriptional regulator, organic hydroperoxide resistance regulator
MGTSARARLSPVSEAWGLMFELFQSHKPRFVALAQEFDLSPPQLGALRSLDPDEPRPMSELAGMLHCDASNITGIVDRLEDRGLVERRSAPHDRRVKMLALTPAGASLRERVAEQMSQPPAELAALSAADQRTLRDLLRRALETRD